MKNLPNQLTLLRICFVPLFIAVYFLPFDFAHPLASLIFILAAVTDWLDGYLARTMKTTTQLGAFLDPLADKLLVVAAVVIVTGEHFLGSLSIVAAIIVMREIVISALREWVAEMGIRQSLAVNYLGKIKTVLQMVALSFLIWYTPKLTHAWILQSGIVLLYLAAFLTLWSMVLYLKISWPYLTLSQEK